MTHSRADSKDIQIFIGYIKVGDTQDYIEYRIKGYTRKSARLRLKKIVNGINSKSEEISTIVEIFYPGDGGIAEFTAANNIIENLETSVL